MTPTCPSGLYGTVGVAYILTGAAAGSSPAWSHNKERACFLPSFSRRERAAKAAQQTANGGVADTKEKAAHLQVAPIIIKNGGITYRTGENPEAGRSERQGSRKNA